MILFKFPYEETFYTIESGSEVPVVTFVSFDNEKTLDFRGIMKEVHPDELSGFTLHIADFPEPAAFSEPQSRDTYMKNLRQVIDFIKAHQLPKLVISREKIVPYTDLSASGSINLVQSFQKIASAYPNAFVYVFNDGNHCWMGAFSELLGQFDKDTAAFRTMSLAGTLPVEEAWTTKETEEQKPVTDYVQGILNRYAEQVQVSETYDHISGSIKHLRNDFRAEIRRGELDRLIADLHPTPAVCGIPKEFCREAIATFEKHDRSFYAGYIRIETAKHISYFVNLRCARFTKTHAHLYAGGGITAKSDTGKEWKETELKADAILKNLVSD